MLGGSYDLTNSNSYNQYAQSLGLGSGGGGWNPARPLIRRLGVGQAGLALQQHAFRAGLEPQKQSAIMRYLMNLSPGNRANLSQRNRSGMFENVARGGDLLNSILQGQGYGAGARMGASAGLVGQGISQANQYDQYLNSPEYETEALRGTLGAISGSTDQDLIDNLYGGSMNVEQTMGMDRSRQSQGLFGQVLGQGLGMAIGGGWNPFRRGQQGAG